MHLFNGSGYHLETFYAFLSLSLTYTLFFNYFFKNFKIKISTI